MIHDRKCNEGVTKFSFYGQWHLYIFDIYIYIGSKQNQNKLTDLNSSLG